MGKGDRRTRRGKIYNGSFGKTRPKASTSGAAKKTASAAKSAAKPVAKTAAKRAKS